MSIHYKLWEGLDTDPVLQGTIGLLRKHANETEKLLRAAEKKGLPLRYVGVNDGPAPKALRLPVSRVMAYCAGFARHRERAAVTLVRALEYGNNKLNKALRQGNTWKLDPILHSLLIYVMPGNVGLALRHYFLDPYLFDYWQGVRAEDIHDRVLRCFNQENDSIKAGMGRAKKEARQALEATLLPTDIDDYVAFLCRNRQGWENKLNHVAAQ